MNVYAYLICISTGYLDKTKTIKIPFPLISYLINISCNDTCM